MWNISNFWLTNYIASELYPSPPHLFAILCSIISFVITFFTADPAWETGDSSEQIPLQEHFTAAFKQKVVLTETFVDICTLS